jgi:hypothetical protein
VHDVAFKTVLSGTVGAVYHLDLFRHDYIPYHKKILLRCQDQSLERPMQSNTLWRRMREQVKSGDTRIWSRDHVALLGVCIPPQLDYLEHRCSALLASRRLARRKSDSCRANISASSYMLVCSWIEKALSRQP